MSADAVIRSMGLRRQTGDLAIEFGVHGDRDNTRYNATVLLAQDPEFAAVAAPARPLGRLDYWGWTVPASGAPWVPVAPYRVPTISDGQAVVDSKLVSSFLAVVSISEAGIDPRSRFTTMIKLTALCVRCGGSKVYCDDCGSAPDSCVCPEGLKGERMECPCLEGGRL